MPILPFLKMINVNDLSNHLHDTKKLMQLTCLQRQKQIQTTCLFSYGWPQLTVSTPPMVGRGERLSTSDNKSTYRRASLVAQW